MKLQLALDTMTLDEAIILAKSVDKYVDILEIGTPLMIREGVRAIKRFKNEFPEKEVLADIKIMDGGLLESEMAFEQGADYTVVLGVADNATITGCINAARNWNRKIVVDLLCVNNLEEKVVELETLGVDVIAVHTGSDQQELGRTPLEDLKRIKDVTKNSIVAVAGGINSKTIEEYVALNPDIVIVGSAICNSEDPVKEAEIIKSKMR